MQAMERIKFFFKIFSFYIFVDKYKNKNNINIETISNDNI